MPSTGNRPTFTNDRRKNAVDFIGAWSAHEYALLNRISKNQYLLCARISFIYLSVFLSALMLAFILSAFVSDKPLKGRPSKTMPRCRSPPNLRFDCSTTNRNGGKYNGKDRTKNIFKKAKKLF